MSEVIMVLEEPWYNTLTEQMFEQVIEETAIRRDTSNWNPYDSGTFISSASK